MADINLPPHPHTLVCMECGLRRDLPEGWQEMLGTDTLTCTLCQQPMVELTAAVVRQVIAELPVDPELLPPDIREGIYASLEALEQLAIALEDDE